MHFFCFSNIFFFIILQFRFLDGLLSHRLFEGSIRVCQNNLFYKILLKCIYHVIYGIKDNIIYFTVIKMQKYNKHKNINRQL